MTATKEMMLSRRFKMGYVKYPKYPLLSTTTVTLESGKQLKTFWKDNTINELLDRMVD